MHFNAKWKQKEFDSVLIDFKWSFLEGLSRSQLPQLPRPDPRFQVLVSSAFVAATRACLINERNIPVRRREEIREVTGNGDTGTGVRMKWVWGSWLCKTVMNRENVITFSLMKLMRRRQAVSGSRLAAPTFHLG